VKKHRNFRKSNWDNFAKMTTKITQIYFAAASINTTAQSSTIYKINKIMKVLLQLCIMHSQVARLPSCWNRKANNPLTVTLVLER